jgi:hypothetical protein
MMIPYGYRSGVPGPRIEALGLPVLSLAVALGGFAAGGMATTALTRGSASKKLEEALDKNEPIASILGTYFLVTVVGAGVGSFAAGKALHYVYPPEPLTDAELELLRYEKMYEEMY